MCDQSPKKYISYSDILPQPSQNRYYQKNRTITAGEDVVKDEPLFTAAVNWYGL